MSLFGGLMGEGEDDPFFGPHMRHLRQMNNMMNSLFADPFGMVGGPGMMALEGGPRHGSSMVPFMPHMPSLTRLLSRDVDCQAGPASASSFSSSTVVMSSGPNGKPQVYSSTSSTKIGPDGVKETRKTLQDSRTGTKKMSIGHHIGERAHVVEREANLYTGDAEENQEFINIEEDDAEDFDREFQHRIGGYNSQRRALPSTTTSLPALTAPMPALTDPMHALTAPMHALTDPMPAMAAPLTAPMPAMVATHTAPMTAMTAPLTAPMPAMTATLPASADPPAYASSHVREVYGTSHPQRRHKNKQRNTHSPSDN